ncbi:MAG: alpha/beta fold hydrolase, partial [Wenzhouxiangella sp.]
VSGGMSELIGAEHSDEFLKLAPHAEHVEVPDAAHMVAGDANDHFLAAISPFLKKQAARRAGKRHAERRGADRS